MTIRAIDEASGVMGKISASMGLIGMELETLGPGFAQLGQVIQGFAVGGPTGAAIVGIGEVVKGLQDSVTAAGNLQTVWGNLQSVMHLTGDAWTTMKTQVDALVESLRTTTTFSDTDLIGAFQSLITYGMSSAQAMQGLSAAVELAAAKHIDLTTAASALGKAFDGNAMLLRRYGIEVATVTQETSLGTEAIKEMGVNLLIATGPQLTAFTAAMADAGLAVQDSTGKMLGHAAILKEITDAWKGGTIDATQLSAIVGALGINFQSSKALAMDYSLVLAKVNDQYGGVAQAQATTYAGLQVQLGNAVQVLGEKIGTILLPALTSILQAIIPMVDAFTNAVPAIEAWIAAIGKLPGIQGTISTFQGIWSGLTKSMSDAWDSVKGDLLPALQQLQDAFNQLNVALQPLWDAFNELWKAITGSNSDFNLFKAILEAIVLVIKGLTVVVQVLTPIIHLIADAFKAAADFLVPILTAIRNAVGGFFDWLMKGFQAFYDWLVGHSLWQDLWNAVLSVVADIGGTLKTIFVQAFSLWTDVFNIGTETIKNILVTGFQVAFTTVQTVVAGATAVLKSIFQGFVDMLSPAQMTWDQLVADVMNATSNMKGTVSDFLSWLVSYWKTQVTAVATFTAAELQILQGLVTASSATLQATWQSMLDSMVSSTQAAFQVMVNDISSQVNAIVATLEAAKAKVSTHSIWPDMLAEMVAQTHAGMAAIQGEFAAGFESPSGIIPRIQAGGQAALAATPSVAPAAGAQGSQAITLPIIVNLDGQQIQTFMEKRMVDTLRQNAGRSKRSGRV